MIERVRERWTRTAGARERRFMDGAGQSWHVYEMELADDERRPCSSLVFECAAVVRRRRSFPADWHALSASDLATLGESPCSMR